VLAGDFTTLEREMVQAAEKYPNVICHELYAIESQDFFLVLMTHEG
jgi:hypothetical protein